MDVFELDHLEDFEDDWEITASLSKSFIKRENPIVGDLPSYQFKVLEATLSTKVDKTLRETPTLPGVIIENAIKLVKNLVTFLFGKVNASIANC